MSRNSRRERRSGAGLFSRLPGVLLSERGSTGFYIVFVIFMAVVVYFKFYYTPKWDPDKPMKIAVPRRMAAVSETAPAVQPPKAPSAIDAGVTANVVNTPAAEATAKVEAVKRPSPSVQEAGGYNVVVTRRAEDVAAEKTMYSKEGSHFIVKFDGGENGVAGHVIAILLEEAQIKVGSDLGYYPADKIEAVLYAKEQFRDVTRSPAWAGALYDGRIKVPAGGLTEKSSMLEKVLFHEYTHALVHRLSHGKAPTWLNEGLAMYEEGEDDLRYAAQLRDFARKGRKDFSIRVLEGSFMGLSTSQAQSAYILSNSATRYIIREFGVSAVRRILEALANGHDMDSAISSSIYMSYDELNRSWLASLSK